MPIPLIEWRYTKQYTYTYKIEGNGERARITKIKAIKRRAKEEDFGNKEFDNN